MTVLSPADAAETAAMVEAMAGWDGPVYLRVCRNDLPAVTGDSQTYRIGQITEIMPEGDIALLATGAMVSIGMEAAGLLAGEGIRLKVINVSTIKPLDVDRLQAVLTGCRAYVTAEEHSVIGGLGSAVHDALAGRCLLPSAMIGIRDSFGTSAYSWEELLTHYGLTAADIAAVVRQLSLATRES